VGEGSTPFVFAFDQLPIVQFIARLPVIGVGFWGTKPVTEVSGEGVEVAAQSVGGDGGDAVLVKTMLEVMDESKGVVLRASAEMQGGDGFADRVEGEPKPRGTGSLTNTCIKFIHLDVGQDEVAEQQIVPALAVTAHALEPAGEGSIGMTGEADKDGDIDPLSKKPEDKLNLFGIGLEVIKWGVRQTGTVDNSSNAFAACNMPKTGSPSSPNPRQGMEKTEWLLNTPQQAGCFFVALER
jgi:hypothetical protein